jgi:hypothetical protein
MDFVRFDKNNFLQFDDLNGSTLETPLRSIITNKYILINYRLKGL